MADIYLIYSPQSKMQHKVNFQAESRLSELSFLPSKFISVQR